MAGFQLPEVCRLKCCFDAEGRVPSVCKCKRKHRCLRSCMNTLPLPASEGDCRSTAHPAEVRCIKLYVIAADLRKALVPSIDHLARTRCNVSSQLLCKAALQQYSVQNAPTLCKLQLRVATSGLKQQLASLLSDRKPALILQLILCSPAHPNSYKSASPTAPRR